MRSTIDRLRYATAQRDMLMAEAEAYSGGRKRASFLDHPYLLLSLCSLFWAANTIIGRVSAGHIPPLNARLYPLGRRVRHTAAVRCGPARA